MVVVLITERLVLRQFTDADVDALLALDGDPRVMRFLDHKTASREQIQTEVLPRFPPRRASRGGKRDWAANARGSEKNC